MFHQQLNQAQQTLNSISQHLRQAQQLCNECSRDLQNMASSMQQAGQASYQGYYQPVYSGMGYNMGFETGAAFTGGRDFGPTMNMAQGTLSTQSPLIDRSTMGAETYQNSLRQFAGAAQGGYAGAPNIGTAQNLAQGTLRTQSPLIDPATMSASTYQSSLQQFSGQALAGTKQAGGAMSGASGSTMGTMGGSMGGVSTGGISMSTPSLPTNEPFASVATMNPDTYQASAQRLGGGTPNLSNIGQQAGISTSSRGYNQ